MSRKSRLQAAASAAIETLEIRRLFATLVVNGGSGDDTCVFETDGSFIYANMNGLLIPQPAGSWDDVEINLGAGDDVVNIINTGAEPVRINLGSGQDDINISTSTRDLDSIDSLVTVAAGTDSAVDFVNMYDYDDTGADEYDVYEPAGSLMRLRKLASGVAGPDIVHWGESHIHAVIQLNDFANDATVASSVTLVGTDERLSFTGGEVASGDLGGSGGDDTLTVSGTISGDNFIYFHGGSGTDTMNVNTSSITGDLPLFQFQGGTGVNDTLNITDPNPTTRHSFSNLNTVRFFEGTTQTASFLAPTDVINIVSTHATQGSQFEMLVVNDETDVTIDAGPGADELTIGDNFITTEFGSGVNIDFSGGTGVDSLEIRDASYNVDRDHIFDNQSYNSDWLGLLTWGSVSSAVLFAGIGNDDIDVGNGLGMQTIDVNGNTGADVFNVVPDLVTNVTVNGNAPTTSPGDVLFITPGTATNGTLTPAGTGAGTYSYQSRSPIAFTGIEQFPAAPTATPPALDLTAAQDSGLSNTDNITNLTTIDFSGGGAPSGSGVKLFRDGVEVASTTAIGSNYTFSDVVFPAGDDTFLMTTRFFNASTQLMGPASAPLSLRVDTTAPAAPTVAPDLDFGSDSGISNSDNITNDTVPQIEGTGSVGNIVRLFVGANLSASDTDLNGTYSLFPSTTDGSWALTTRFEDIAGNRSAASPTLSLTVDTVAPATPTTAPDLAAASDSGVSNIDNITNDNTPTFIGLSGGNIVRLLNGTTLQGSDTDLGTNYSITTAVLNDASRPFTVKHEDVAGNQSAASPVLNTVIDTVGPTVSNPQFNFNSTQNIKFTYSENVQPTIANTDLQLNNGTSNVPSSSIALSYTPNIATFTFPGFTRGMLPNGNYTATIPGSSVTDFAGNASATAQLSFFFRQADANHDGAINFDDYALIDAGFLGGLTGFTNGDFNYDGRVDFDDYAIIDAAFLGNGPQVRPAPATGPGTSPKLRPEPAPWIL